jgi:hypothetical protein
MIACLLGNADGHFWCVNLQAAAADSGWVAQDLMQIINDLHSWEALPARLHYDNHNARRSVLSGVGLARVARLLLPDSKDRGDPCAFVPFWDGGTAVLGRVFTIEPASA